MKNRRVPLLIVLLLLLAPTATLAGSGGAIAKETTRVSDRPGGILQVWWLPGEYWAATARELGWPEDKVTEVQSRLTPYLVLGILDATPKGKGLFFEEHRPMSDRMIVKRGGEQVEPLRRFDPELTRLIPELSFPLRVSLGPLGKGVRLLFFSNLSTAGKPIVTPASEGQLSVIYTPHGDTQAYTLTWRPPLTAVAGHSRCPEGGEPLEANWTFCPWHGVKAEAPTAAAP